jgi:hypothetical protein
MVIAARIYALWMRRDSNAPRLAMSHSIGQVGCNSFSTQGCMLRKTNNNGSTQRKKSRRLRTKVSVKASLVKISGDE